MEYDVIVIGGGSAGLTVAFGMSRKQKSVLLVEQEKVGGECTWSGCVPSKSFIHLSQHKGIKDIFHNVRESSETIFLKESPEVLENMGIEYIQGHAEFHSSTEIIVNNCIYTADSIVIATGSVPKILPLAGLSEIEYLTNQNFFHLDSLPTSITFIGGGVISLELSMALSTLGTKCTILEKLPVIFPSEDEEFQKRTETVIKNHGIILKTSVNDLSFSKNNDGMVTISYTQDGVSYSIESEKIFLGLGRKPKIDQLALEKVGVRFSSKGIEVNEYMETTAPNVYAIGDVVDSLKFSHVAELHGETLVHNLCNPHDKKKAIISSPIWIAFTTPELARCGANINELQKEKTPFHVFDIEAEHLDRAFLSGDHDFFLRIITDEKGYILGSYGLGERMGELISTVQLLKANSIPLQNVVDTLLPYPGYTLSIRKLAKKARNTFNL